MRKRPPNTFSTRLYTAALSVESNPGVADRPVRELVWIIDPVTGDLTLEGLSMEEAEAAAADFLSRPRVLNCAQPIATTALPTSSDPSSPVLRVAALWHGSVVEGPGRRSVVQVQGCP